MNLIHQNPLLVTKTLAYTSKFEDLKQRSKNIHSLIIKKKRFFNKTFRFYKIKMDVFWDILSTYLYLVIRL